MRVSSRLGISEGRVSCPVGGKQVNAEECLVCRSFKGIRDGDIRTGVIVCKTEMPELSLSTGLYGSVNGTRMLRSR